MLNFLSKRGLPPAEKAEIEGVIQEGDLLTAASLISSRMRKADLRDCIDNIFIKPSPQPHEIHKIVAELGPDSFITTNYDRLIDDAYQQVHNGLVLVHVNNDQPIEQARMLKHNQSRFIFTPHGRADRVDTIILSREDYRRVQFDSKLVASSLEHLLISRPVVYLGFGLRDPDFLMIKDQIATTYKGGEREHFAVLPDVGDVIKKFWRDSYGINIISYKTYEEEIIDKNGQKYKRQNHGELLELLRKLHQEIKSPSTKIPEIKNAIIRFCENLEYSFSNNLEQSIEILALFRADLSPHDKTELTYHTSPVLDLLNRDENLIIIGSPGSGKTFAIQTYAFVLAKRTLEEIRSSDVFAYHSAKHILPLILPMKEYGGDLISMISARLPRSINYESALESGLFVLIFDAIDEITRDFVDTKVFSNDLSSFFSKYPSNKFVFTSRILGYFSFLPLPVFELQPISQEEVENRLSSVGISEETIVPTFSEILQNPLLLKLFIELQKDGKEKYSGFVSLLRGYLHRIESKIKEQRDIDLSITRLLSPICYELIDRGLQSMTGPEIKERIEGALEAATNHKNLQASEILNIMISARVLVPDAEGKVSLFHKTLVEYLAANELVCHYQQQKFPLEEHIDLHRWDETIILFISLLSPEEGKSIIKKIAETDINFACSAFESAALKDETIGLFLFDNIISRLSEPLLPGEKKRSLGQALTKISPYGREEILEHWLNDKIIGPRAAICLARMGAKHLITRIISLLVKDNVWLSDFAKALSMIVEKSNINELIEQGKTLNDKGLAFENLSYVLSHLESEELFAEIDRLCQSTVEKERIFAVCILGELDSNRSKEMLAKMLQDSKYEVLWRVVHGLNGMFGKKAYKTKTIIANMFDLLKKSKIGSTAACYLAEQSDEEIINVAVHRLEKPKNDYELINLCAILAKKFPDRVRKLLFEQLNHFRVKLKEPLYMAISKLPKDYIVPDILKFLRVENHDLQVTVLESLSWNLGFKQEVSISENDALYMLGMWEQWPNLDKSRVGYFLADNCYTITKPILLQRLNNPNYPHRLALIELVDRLPLGKGDLLPDTVNWLITQFGTESDEDKWGWRSSKGCIVGQVSDESFIVEKVVPLLATSNKSVKRNAYAAIKTAERALGKRLLKE